MLEKLQKYYKFGGIIVGVVILVMYVLNIFSVTTMIIILLVDVGISLIVGNVLIPIIANKYESKNNQNEVL